MLAITDPQIRHAPGVIDLSRGHPEPALLPLAEFRDAAGDVMGRASSELLQYSASRGSSFFRHHLAAFLTPRYGFEVDPEQLFSTGSISQALSLVCTTLARPGDLVLVEEPTYFLALGIFKDHGLRVKSVATDEHGIRLDALQEAVEEEHPAFVYLIPSFHNPTGRTLTQERREGLVELAKAHDLLVVTDDAYQILDHGGGAPACMAAWLQDAKVLSLGSFAKILGPGLRLGWAHASPELLRALGTNGVLKSGGCANPIVGTIVAELIRSGFQDSHLDHLNAVYAERATALMDALRRHVPEGEFEPVSGGYFVWLRLPSWDTEQLAKEAEHVHKVKAQPSRPFTPDGTITDALRLCFAYNPPDQLEEGVQRLARALRAD